MNRKMWICKPKQTNIPAFCPPKKMGALERIQDLIESKQSHLFLCLSLTLRSSFLFKAAARRNSPWTWSEGSSLSDKLFTCFLDLKRIESDPPTSGIQTLCWANMGRVGGSQGWTCPIQVSYTFTTNDLPGMTYSSLQRNNIHTRNILKRQKIVVLIMKASNNSHCNKFCPLFQTQKGRH